MLSAKGTPKMPVTFNSMTAAGVFENELSTITKPFGENGVASVVYKTRQSVGPVTHVLVGSPVHTGQLKYTIQIVAPETN